MSSHIIHTMKVSLRVPDMENAFPMQQRVKECLAKEWDDQLTAILDKYGAGNRFLQIARLEVQLEPMPAHQWEKHFKEQFMEALDKALSHYSQEAPAQTGTQAFDEEEDRPWGPCSASEQYQDVWLFFMQHGLLPWWAQPGPAEELEEKVIAAVKAQPQFCKERWTRAWLKGHLSVQRWVQQCSASLQHAVLEAIAGSTAAAMITSYEATMLLALSASNSKVNLRQLQCLYWDVIFQLLFREEIRKADILPLMKTRWKQWVSVEMDAVLLEKINITGSTEDGANEASLHSNARAGESIATAVAAEAAPGSSSDILRSGASNAAITKSTTSGSATAEKKSSSPDLGIGEHLLINDAGLVLLHPFLLHLFKHFEWLQENDTRIDPQYVQRAVHLLAFLAGGEEQMPEYNLVFPKLLCGLPLDTPLEKDVHLSDVEKQQALELLEVVIRYWDALGSTSPDGLRSTFLQREGKLIFQDDQWLLMVTPQTVDILLNRLPWGLGFVKLPWMEQFLKVQWNP